MGCFCSKSATAPVVVNPDARVLWQNGAIVNVGEAPVKVASKMPNVVLIGNCGTGKSYVVEKLAGLPHGKLSSDDGESHTHLTLRLAARSQDFTIVDTPGMTGSNRKLLLKDNQQVMMALNAGPVSLMLFVAKAEVRKEAMVQQIKDLVRDFIDFSELFGVVVTHMDEAGSFMWTREDLITELDEFFGGPMKVIFSSKDKDPLALCDDIKKHFVSPARVFNIDSLTFLSHFRICSGDLAIMRRIKNKVSPFQSQVEHFKQGLDKWQSSDHPDLCSAFNRWMSARITVIQQEFSQDMGWDYQTPMKFEAREKLIIPEEQIGFLSYLSSQLKASLLEVRTICLTHHMAAQFGAGERGELRACYLCGTIWAKFEGCDGATRCGSRPTTTKDYFLGEGADREWHSGGSRGSFEFQLGEDRASVSITKTGSRQARMDATAKPPDAAVDKKTGAYDYVHPDGRVEKRFWIPQGCGKYIEWSRMDPVESGKGWTIKDLNPPAKSDLHTIKMSDIPQLDEESQRAFNRLYLASLPQARRCSALLFAEQLYTHIISN